MSGADELQHRHAYPRMWMVARTAADLIFDESVQMYTVGPREAAGGVLQLHDDGTPVRSSKVVEANKQVPRRPGADLPPYLLILNLLHC